MNCEYVQEKLSAFLDREESLDDIDDVLSHLYGCDSCKSFFGSAIKLRSLASDDRISYPVGLDECVLKEVKRRRNANPFSYRLKLPVYVVSAAGVILIVLSFTFGYLMQETLHQEQINAILKAPPSQVVYSMPAQVVYPVSMHESKGEIR